MRCLSILILMLSAIPAFGSDVVYVSVAGEKRIAVYQIDSATGRLTHVADTSTTGEPGALTTDSKKRFLFAALRSTGELSSFRIEPTTGKLTRINTVPSGADPAHVSVDKDGKFLLTAYYIESQVSVHSIGEDGALSKKPNQIVKTKEKAHAVVLNPGQSAILVPHTGPNVIYSFWWDRENGKMAPSVLGSKFFERPKNTGPRHLVFHPTLELNRGVDLLTQIAYVVNEQGGSVTMYHTVLNPINWFLEPKQTLSTLPSDFKGTNACAEIKLHPSNKFLYASNRGHDSIAGFSVNKDTGELTSLGQTPTEKNPRSFDIDPSGKYLYAAGESSGRLAAYRINETSGKLERIGTYDAGKMSWWVMTVRLPGR